MFQGYKFKCDLTCSASMLIAADARREGGKECFSLPPSRSLARVPKQTIRRCRMSLLLLLERCLPKSGSNHITFPPPPRSSRGGRELPKSAFLLRGRKYLLPKTRRPFPDVEFKGIKSSPSIQQPVKRRWTRLAASQWESNEASEDLT